MALTPLPPAPDPTNPSTFAALADAFVAALGNMVTQINAQGSVPAGIAPSFMATLSPALTLVSGTATLVPFNTEVYDVGAQYDPVTNFQYSLGVAGKYHFDTCLQVTATGGLTRLEVYIENNAGIKLAGNVATETGTTGTLISCSINVASTFAGTARVWVIATGSGTITLNAAVSSFSGFYTGP